MTSEPQSDLELLAEFDAYRALRLLSYNVRTRALNLLLGGRPIAKIRHEFFLLRSEWQ